MAMPYYKLPSYCKQCEHHHYCMEGRNEYCNCKVCESLVDKERREEKQNNSSLNC